jgi:hypothetical protein
MHFAPAIELVTSDDQGAAPIRRIKARHQIGPQSCTVIIK